MLLNIIYAAAVLLVAVGLGASLRRYPAGRLLAAGGTALLVVHNVLGHHWWLAAAWTALTGFWAWGFTTERRKTKEASA